MEQNLLPLANTNTNGATPPRVRRSHTKYEGRVDHEHTMLVIAEVFARKPEGFTVPDVQQWLRKDDGRMPSDTLIGKIVNQMVTEKLAERLDKCREHRRLYRIVKSEMMTGEQVIAVAKARTAALVRTPEQIEQDLSLLEAFGIDTKAARTTQTALNRALETKASLEK